jgi:tight adherence protein B
VGRCAGTLALLASLNGLAAAQESWPGLIDDVRILTANLGRSVPQALFEAGRRAPAELQPAFEAAHREWLLSVDFERTIGVLKDRLADPTADAACETLLVAHEIGGTDLDRRLEALAADRALDVQERKDARARQAGVRFARRFVLLVPGGMALVGTTIGSGRTAYQTAWGQAMVVLGLLVIAGCWAWASRLLRLPAEERVWR